MKNTLTDLNNVLFEQLERLQDDTALKTEEAFKREMERSRAVTNIAAQIIQNGALTLRACQYASEYGDNAKKPAIGMTEEVK